MQPRLVIALRFVAGLLVLALCAVETGCGKRDVDPNAPSVVPVPIPDGPPLSAEDEKALVQMVQAAVGEYFKQHNRYPKSVAELQEARLLELIPAAPAGRKFVIDPTDGRFSVQPK